MPQGIEALASITAEGQTSHTLFQAARPANTFGYTREQQIEALHKLREPFAPTEIRHLPRVWCGACKNSRGQGCQKHRMSKCGKCGQRMPEGGHIDLAYVGHAEATNRLLNVDPFWDWEPLTVDERGLPQLDGYRGLWIRLTVCGMTRLGYGHAGDKTGGDSVKEIIGDAIRNAGMRFGMALDLWTTSDLEIIESGGDSLEQDAVGEQEDRKRQETAPAPAGQGVDHLARLRSQVSECWDNSLALAQIVLDAEKCRVADQEVPLKTGGTATLRDLLNARITELGQAAQGGSTERSAA
ncbi:hypothetical protein [Streptomyces leeuwenhoekii]|uniref:Sle1_027 protein n=1 Tax=Streptomyces leeuwenhoekii TaxID=1437453 RepID=A0A0F7VKJ1_STRLW|nr:hypothetical protein [Streptomyces leeuwenhoekii]CQR59194.1 sle1_027 [Streptomyces leeuwenhoekii]